MRNVCRMLFALLAAAGAVPLAAPAQAALVTVNFSGTVTSTVAPYAAGTAYSGSFSYDSDASPLGVGGNFAFYRGISASFTIGGDTVTDSAPAVGVDEFGGFDVNLNNATGTGPFNGFSVFLQFRNSADPSIIGLSLPAAFPTDFSGSVVRYFINDIPPDLGPISSYAQVVPEPGTIGLLGAGIAGLAAVFCPRRRRTPGPAAAMA